MKKVLLLLLSTMFWIAGSQAALLPQIEPIVISGEGEVEIPLDGDGLVDTIVVRVKDQSLTVTPPPPTNPPTNPPEPPEEIEIEIEMVPLTLKSVDPVCLGVPCTLPITPLPDLEFSFEFPTPTIIGPLNSISLFFDLSIPGLGDYTTDYAATLEILYMAPVPLPGAAVLFIMGFACLLIGRKAAAR